MHTLCISYHLLLRPNHQLLGPGFLLSSSDCNTCIHITVLLSNHEFVGPTWFHSLCLFFAYIMFNRGTQCVVTESACLTRRSSISSIYVILRDDFIFLRNTEKRL
jgi:hypothetical protein